MTPLTGTCLCGAVSFSHTAPAQLVRCNCTACRRYGTIWAHGRLDAISITANGPLTRYIRSDSDGDLAFISCATCGVTTHWEPVGKSGTMAVNAALAEPDMIKNLPLRHFDGADTWTFLDGKPR